MSDGLSDANTEAAAARQLEIAAAALAEAVLDVRDQAFGPQPTVLWIINNEPRRAGLRVVPF